MSQPHKDNRAHDLDGGLGASYEENSSPFDMPPEIMTMQFVAAPHHNVYHAGGNIAEEDDCSKDLSMQVKKQIQTCMVTFSKCLVDPTLAMSTFNVEILDAKRDTAFSVRE